MNSKSRKIIALLLALVLMLPFVTVDARAEGEEQVTVDVSLNTQFRDKDGKYSRIPNAVSKAVNTETGEEFIFKMDAEGNIPYLKLPSGTYKLSIVSVPEDFSEGKRLDLSYTETVTIEETSRAKGWKVTVKEIPTIDVSLNTQFRDKDGKYSRIPNAVSKAVNTETGEEFIFKMDAEGNIPHLQIPSGTYKLSIVSVPEEFSEGKRLDLSYTETVTIEETSRAKGWKVTVKEIPTIDVSLNT
ncbi:hypothetical protein, partial [Helcococcus sueciensis]